MGSENQSNEPQETRLTSLSPQDGQVLDALLAQVAPTESGKPAVPELSAEQARQLPADAAPRLAPLRNLLALLGEHPTQDPPHDLADRTLARIAEARQRERFAQQVHSVSAPAVAFRWSELIAVAAVLLICVSLLWPVLSRTREDARRIACSSNLATAGMGFGQYAADNNGALPRYDTRPGAIWWNVGQEPSKDGIVQSNSAHLFKLARQRYVLPEVLSCPSNGLATTVMTASSFDWAKPGDVPFSYQNQYTPQPIRINVTPQIAILADKNPLFVVPQNGQRLTFIREISPESPSRVHDRRGQNVLTGDLRVKWTTGPIMSINGRSADNIWTANGVSEYTGTETPAQPDDSFLVP